MTRLCLCPFLAGTAFVAAMVLASPGRAHGFGQRYDLPLPLELYLAAAAAAVLLSFVVMALVGRPAAAGVARVRAPRVLLSAATLARLAPLLLLVRLLVLALLLLLLAAGFWGATDPFRNLGPTLVWVVWWVGLAFVSAGIGDLWAFVNPWATAYDGLLRATDRLSPGRRLIPLRAYPRNAAAWPAVGLLLVFFWLELVWDGGSRPDALARWVLAYSLLTWSAMLLFGKRAWLRNGEAFSRVFGLFALCAPLYVDRRSRALCLRPPLFGLRRRWPLRVSDTVLIVLLLSGVSFDGLKETPLWALLWDAVLTWARDSGIGAALAAGGIDLYTLVSTLALLALPAAVAALYGVFSLMIAATAARGSVNRVAAGKTARLFILSLLPIAVGYHVAHYLSCLLVTGQWIIPLFSDPFGFGWDLFGTADYRVDIAIIDARFAWNAAVAAIVVGHVAAVWLAHDTALARFGDRRTALRSQFPMLVLMVGYTVASLWIIAQPIVEVEA